MSERNFTIEPGLDLPLENISYNPDSDFFKKLLKPYYVVTRDGQYLFASKQKGRRPDRVFSMVPPNYPLGNSQQRFDPKIGKKITLILQEYLRTVPVIVQDGIQGEIGYKVGLRITTSILNPHSAYMAWMGKLMIFPPEREMPTHCWNYIIPEPLPLDVIQLVLEVWPQFDPSEPLTLFDFMDMRHNIRRVYNIGVDYFGGAFKKPNLTMVWNKAERDGLISYHAGCTGDRVLKGLSGTGKTTLTVGPQLEQDDALLGLPLYDRNGNVGAVELIGLEAGSFAKSEGLSEKSPEWQGLMTSRNQEQSKSSQQQLVLAMNIDCENVDIKTKEIGGFSVPVPSCDSEKEVGSLQCQNYTSTKTKNGRFIFRFLDLNPSWGYNRLKILRTEGLAFKRFDMVEPMIRITDPVMAVALDSACESIITSAVAGKREGARVRSYAATDFMVGEQADQAIAKLKIYSDLGLGVDGKLVFFITNSGYMGEHDFLGNRIEVRKSDGTTWESELEGEGQEQGKNGKEQRNTERGQGEKITVEDSKKLVQLVESRKIKNWIINPVFGYLVPDPNELERDHGFENFKKRFNPLRFYSAEQIQAFAERDIKERTQFLATLFKRQSKVSELRDIINFWNTVTLPSILDIHEYYTRLYGELD